MPDGAVHILLLVTDNAHAKLRNEIIWNAQQDALENIQSVGMAMGFKIGFPKQPIGFKVFGIAFQDMLTMCNGFFKMALIDQGFDFTVVNAQGNFAH